MNANKTILIILFIVGTYSVVVFFSDTELLFKQFKSINYTLLLLALICFSP